MKNILKSIVRFHDLFQYPSGPLHKEKGGKTMTTDFQVGQSVNVPCDIGNGAFSDEYLVTLTTQKGPSSGFVQDRYVNKSAGSIRGIIRKIDGETITIQLPGSYFLTAMGFMTFPAHWANERITVAD